MDDLNRFTYDQLADLHLATYRAALAAFERAELLYGQMAGMNTRSPEYTRAKLDAKAALTAGTDAHETTRAIGRELDKRRAAREAQRAAEIAALTEAYRA